MGIWSRVKRFLVPPVFEDDEEKTRIAGVLNVIVWLIMTAAVAGLISLFFLAGPGLVLTIFGVVGLTFAGLFVLLRLGYVRWVGFAVPLILWVGVSIPAWQYAGIRDTALTGYFLVVIIVGLILGVRVLFFFVALSVLSAVALFVAEMNGLIEGLPGNPPFSDVIFITLGLIAAGLLLRSVLGRITQEKERARMSAQLLAESNRELVANRDALAAQAQTLERRARYLQANAVVAQEAASEVGNLPRLLDGVANVIGEQFGFYHVGLFILDAQGEWAELLAASSAGGQQMLIDGHRLRIGAQGVVGNAAGEGRYRLVRDVRQDAAYFDNPFLPETRSEIALPMRVGSAVIGVLDVQSTLVDAFTHEDVITLQTLADQVALAISNARLLQRAQESLEAERQLYGELSREAWRGLLRAQSELGYVSDGQGVRAAALLEPQMAAALAAGVQIRDEAHPESLSIPIRVRGEVIGVVDGRKPDGSVWSVQEVELLQAMIEQLNVALEGARLYRDTQRRAAEEQLIGRIAANLARSLEVDVVLRTIATELGQALPVDEVVVLVGEERR